MLTAGDGVITDEIENENFKPVGRHAADYALLEELNHEREIYVYNNSKEVFTKIKI